MSNALTIASGLLDAGRLELDLGEPFAPLGADADLVRLDGILGEVDRLTRLDARGGVPLPALELEAARWGLARLHHLSRLLVDRERGAADVAVELSAAAAGGPDPDDADARWSVALSLRHLTSLARLASALMADDPVATEIERLRALWPDPNFESVP